ncbi:branched-chain-amino-acid aminotransferase, cytosolic-like [Physella acuta]|uniref:branched-chain-amino-acid aminotransferase, cytosolic-like n=1 Tax=Physella acuta TaxID=109671 RepID=UPI0027DC292A|nr:branched-chain-amino-acid aminotransferase, cytosolic-like [Physella acuta]
MAGGVFSDILPCRMSLWTQVSRQSKKLTLCYTRLMSSFRYEDLQITLTDKPQKKPDNDKLKFGAHTADHMLEIDWSAEDGWGVPQIRPVTPLQIHPAAKVLHYACELFEGMKAYRCVDNKIRMFRPMENMKRMSRSAKRSALPDFDKHELLKCIKKLISVDQEWVPYSDKCTLYVRPTFIGTEPTLGVTESNMAKLFVITGPVGPYFPTGMKPVSLLADPQYVRAWPGGCGNYKMGSNYAPTTAIQSIAVKKHDCQQVLWLFGEDHQMTEVGTMNLFVFWVNEKGEEELITPPLETGMILPGVTRKSLLELSRQWDEFKVSEQVITMKMFIKALNEGRVKEVFGAGTACVVCPVSKILYQGQELKIDAGKVDCLTQRFYKEINDIHFYRKPHHWMEWVEDEKEISFRSAGAQV